METLYRESTVLWNMTVPVEVLRSEFDDAGFADVEIRFRNPLLVVSAQTEERVLKAIEFARTLDDTLGRLRKEDLLREKFLKSQPTTE